MMPNNQRARLHRRDQRRTGIASLVQLVLLAVPSLLLAQQLKPQVLIIGSMHAPHAFFVEPGYTPAHIWATLDKFRPTMVGVESNPLWFSHGIFSGNTYEAQYTAVPWAVEHGVPVFGIDWQDVEGLASLARRGLEQRRAWSPDSARTLPVRHEQARRLAARIEGNYATVEGDPGNVHLQDRFLWYNSAGYAETTREWWDSEGRRGQPGVGRPVGDRGYTLFQRIDTRDNHIVEHILTLARRYPGSRVAVILGYGHKADLDRKLARYDDIRLVQLADLGPLTSADVAAAWRPLDAFAALGESLDGFLYFYNPQGVNRDRVARLIQRLKTAGIDNAELRYFEARYYLIENRYDEAERLLRAGASGDNSAFSYRPTGEVDWGLSIAQMARLALGQLHDLRGERARALQLYQMLLDELERSAPAVAPEGAFTDPGAMATDGHKAFMAVFGNHAIRELLHLLLREPWSLSP